MSAKETRQSDTAQLRAVDRGTRTVEIVASTYDLDSHGTRIDQSGWDLERFRKNPVICLQHDDRGYTGSNGLPVANAIPDSIRVDGQKLMMRLRFPAEGTFPLADTVFNLIAEGFLRGVSVGFEPVEWEDTDEEESGYKKSVRVYRRCNLMEVSLVTIPSNDNTLVQRAATNNADVSVIRRMTEQMEHLLDEQKESPEDIAKWRAYFENKQPANREATKVLEKFYKRILKEDAPADEVDAWKRMADAIEAMEEKPSEIVESTPAPAIEPAPEEPTPSPTPEPVEAPQDARKVFVQIPLSALPTLSKSVRDTCVEAVVKASQQGLPSSEWDRVIEATGSRFQDAISHFHPSA